MHKRVLTLAVFMVGVLGTHGQGWFNFTNFSTSFSLEAPVFNVDGTPLGGDRFVAQLLGGPDADNLELIGPPAKFVRDGFFVGRGRTIPDVPAGQDAAVKVLAWDTETGDSFEEATVKGMSTVFTQPTCCKPLIENPEPLLNMESFSLVPEPPIWAMSMVGLLMLAIWRGLHPPGSGREHLLDDSRVCPSRSGSR